MDTNADGTYAISRLIVEGRRLPDGRLIAKDAITWRETPLALKRAHTSAFEDNWQVVGRIDEIERRKYDIAVKGVFDLEGHHGTEAYRLVRGGFCRTASAELIPTEYDVVFTPDFKLEVDINKAILCAAALTPTPAFDTATIKASAAPDTESHVSQVKDEDGTIPVAPPASWFHRPEPNQETRMTITEDGQFYGHAAIWGTAHRAFNNRVVNPPRSRSGYEEFHLAPVVTADGTQVDVGQVTFQTGHADMHLNGRQALRHYDDTGTVAADVRVVDGELGIWVCGALRPGMTPEAKRELLAAKMSGDWRNDEMIAILAVNVPGFPVPKAKFEGASRLALVAAGAMIESGTESDENAPMLVASGGIIISGSPEIAELASTARSISIGGIAAEAVRLGGLIVANGEST